MSKFPKFYHSLSQGRILRDLIKGMCAERHITIICGQAYVGKTRLAMQLAQAFAMGVSFFWKEAIEPKRVAYFTERSTESVRRDCQDRNIDLSAVTVISVLELPKNERAEYERDRYAWLQKIITELEPEIVFLDTFGHFLPNYAQGSGKMNDYATMARALRELQIMALELPHAATFFLMHHFVKEKTGSEYANFKHKSSGSASIAGNTLSMWGLSAAGNIDEKTGHSDYVELSVIYHHAAPPPSIYFKADSTGHLDIVTREEVLKSLLPPVTKNSRVDQLTDIIKAAPGAKLAKKELLEIVQDKMKVSLTNAYMLISRAVKNGVLASVTEGELDEEFITFPTVQ